jgi:hypothetical protein
MPDPVELKLERMSASEKSQLERIFKIVWAGPTPLELSTTQGEFKIPALMVEALRDWMEYHPGELMPYWMNVLERPVYERLCKKSLSFVHQVHRGAAPLDCRGESMEKTKKPSSESVLHFILAAHRCGLIAKHDPDARVMLLGIAEGPALLTIQLSLETGFWTVSLGQKPRMATKLHPGSEGVQAVLAEAYRFYEALDPDGFENGLEQLLEGILRAVKDWYNVK